MLNLIYSIIIYISVNKYNCIYCNYRTNKRFNYDKHINTKKHKKNKLTLIIEGLPPTAEGVPQLSEGLPQLSEGAILKKEKNILFICEYCDNTIKRKDNLHRHYKTCKYKREYDLKQAKVSHFSVNLV